MLEAAGRGFRSHGYSGIGVDGLAKAAGVTSGAIYSHFGSKDAAFDAALAAGLDEVIEAVPKLQSEHGASWVEALAENHSGKAHRGDLACGCAMATLTPEVIRSGPAVQAAFEKKMTLIADAVARGLADTSNENPRARAWVVLSLLIGGLSVARAMRSTEVADQVADAVKTAAVKAAGRPRSTAPDVPPPAGAERRQSALRRPSLRQRGGGRQCRRRVQPVRRPHHPDRLAATVADAAGRAGFLVLLSPVAAGARRLFADRRVDVPSPADRRTLKTTAGRADAPG